MRCILVSALLAAVQGDDAARALHKRLDADGSGKADLGELFDFAKEMHMTLGHAESAEGFKDLDKDEDGFVSKAEYYEDVGVAEDLQDEHSAAEIAKFEAADKNNDGKLDKEETANVLFQVDPESKVVDVVAGHKMKEKDTDDDGKLTIEELFGPGSGRQSDYSILDENQDGFVDLAELRYLESGLFDVERVMATLRHDIDHDGDGDISVDELVKHWPEFKESETFEVLSRWMEHDEL